MEQDTTDLAGLCINFRAVRPRKSRVYLAESSSPMSDSHVNDIRYTALWRPLVKAREAPAALTLRVGRFLERNGLRRCFHPRAREKDLALPQDAATANSICPDGKRRTREAATTASSLLRVERSRVSPSTTRCRTCGDRPVDRLERILRACCSRVLGKRSNSSKKISVIRLRLRRNSRDGLPGRGSVVNLQHARSLVHNLAG